MKIAVIGSGYVGLVSGACFAEFGWSVTCVDKDVSKIDMLNQGKIPIYEPGLETLVQNNCEKGRLSFTTDLKSTVRDSDVVFIAVGTPPDSEGGHADLTFVFQVGEEIANAMDGYTVVVTKSTVPVDTGRRLKQRILDVNPKADFDVVSNPEFLREGSAIEDFMRPNRVVIGSESERASNVMKQLYRPLFLLETPIVFTNLETSELIKYASNAFLATKIAFINEIANLCEKCGADVQDVSKGMGLDQRIGKKFLHSGPGYGGSCFPKDTLALVQTANDFGTPTPIVDTVVKSNDDRKRSMAQKVIDACQGSVEGKSIAVLGVTFKPNTDDMRDSPSLDIIPDLQKSGAQIKAFDPQGMKNAQSMLKNVTWASDVYDCLQEAEAVVIITEWNEFRAIDFEKAKTQMKFPLMIDLRNIYNPEEMKANGFDYVSIGRPAVRLDHIKTLNVGT